MINITHTKANNPSVRIGSMILIIRRTDSSTFLIQFCLSRNNQLLDVASDMILDTISKYIGFFSFYIEVFKSLVDKEVNIGQKAYDFPMISQVAFKESSRNLKNDLQK